MNQKYKNKYRIASARAPWWDYGTAGAYFITICTQDRRHFFGEIHQGVQKLSNIGVLADVLWHEIPHHARNIELGAFVVMPNHVHGILILNHNENIDPNSNSNIGIVETRHALSLPHDPINPQPVHYRFQNQGKNTISSIMGSYKSAVTKHARRLGFEFSWQARFHDHIIRNDGEYQRINDYIESNPMNWSKDKFFPQNA
jgi:REP element-mobilizing transposase RayT